MSAVAPSAARDHVEPQVVPEHELGSVRATGWAVAARCAYDFVIPRAECGRGKGRTTSLRHHEIVRGILCSGTVGLLNLFDRRFEGDDGGEVGSEKILGVVTLRFNRESERGWGELKAHLAAENGSGGDCGAPKNAC